MWVRIQRIVENLALIAALALAHRGGLQWLAESLSQGAGRYHGLVLAALLLLLARKGLASLGRPIHLRAAPLGLLLAATAAGVAVQPLGAGLLEAIAAAAAGYGLLGLLMPAASWRQGRVVFLLALLALPSMDHLQAYVGFPLRLATAGAVADLLTAVGVSNIDLGTVLVIDGQETYIDLPCSGVRSLWSGATFFVAATWIERRRLGAGWVCIGLLLAGLLALSNGLRVAALVGLVHVLELPLLAKVLHAPLGVIGFVVSCALGFAGLRLLSQHAPSGDRPPAVPGRSRAGLLLAGVLLASSAISLEPPAREAHPLTMPADVVLLAPTAAELALVGRHGGQIGKARFSDGALSGSVVMVQSQHWRAQHRPDVCLRAAGADLGTVQPARVDEMAVRFAPAETAAGAATALWWFQSPSQVTSDHTHRIVSGLLSPEPWMLVSILVDDDIPLNDPNLIRLVAQMHSHAAAQLRSQL